MIPLKEINLVIRSASPTTTPRIRLVVEETIFDTALHASSAFRMEDQEICPPHIKKILENNMHFRAKEHASKLHSKKERIKNKSDFHKHLMNTHGGKYERKTLSD